MKSYFIYLSVFSLVFVAIFSCRPKENISKENDIQFDTIHMVNNYHIDNDSTQPSCNIKLAFTYPSLSKETNVDSLQDIFISCFFNETYMGLSPQAAAKDYINSYIENYKEDFRIFSQDRIEHDSMDDVYSSYYETDSNDILFNKNGILSFQVTKTNYKGGATSYDDIKNYVIDIKKMQLVDETDIFYDEYEKALNTVLRDNLLKTKKVKSLSELENLGYFGLDEMLPNGNFTLDDKGITYIFNKGEYSSLKTDPIKIFIAYDEIAPLVKENSLISQFIAM